MQPAPKPPPKPTGFCVLGTEYQDLPTPAYFVEASGFPTTAAAVAHIKEHGVTNTEYLIVNVTKRLCVKEHKVRSIQEFDD